MKWIAVINDDVILLHGATQYYFRRCDVEFYLIGLDDSLVNRYCKSTAIPFGDCIDFENWVDFEEFEKEHHDAFMCHIYLAWINGKLKPYMYE